MKHTNFKKLLLPSLFFIVFSFFLSCKKEEKVDPKPVADFTYVVTGNSVQFTNTSTNYVSSAWTFSDAGSVSTGASAMHTFSTPGAYKVKLVVTSKDGSTSTKEKTVEIQAAVITNLLLNNTFVNSENWTVTEAFSNGITDIISTFNNKITLSSSGAGNEAGILISQAVELTPGTYKLALDVSTEDTQNNNWINLMLLNEQPEDGTDPDEESIVIGIDGCNDKALVGDLASLGTVGQDGCRTGTTTNGQVVIATAGRYYFAIGTGIYDGTFGNNYNINSVSLTKMY